MPKLLGSDDMQTSQIPGLRGFGYSAVRTDNLGASEYTLVTVAVDTSPSTRPFAKDLQATLKSAVDACAISPKAGNILLRVMSFASTVYEVHGFKPLAEIDTNVDYKHLVAGGGTALFDAAASGVGAMTDFGRLMSRKGYGVNAILFVITDGEDNSSSYTAETVRDKCREALKEEALESIVTVLIGINASGSAAYLQDFAARAEFTAYKDAGDATPRNMAKMADFVSKSVSSQASAQGQQAAGAIVI